MRFFQQQLIKHQRVLTSLIILALVSLNNSNLVREDQLIEGNHSNQLDDANTMLWWWQHMLNNQRAYLRDNQNALATAPASYTAAFKLDQNSIKSRIMGKAVYREKLSKLIWQARHESDEVKHYIDLVLQYMPELRIRPVTLQYLASLSAQSPIGFSGAASFSPFHKELWLATDYQNEAEAIGYVIHEFDHAFRVLAHEALSGMGKTSLYPEPYFPYTEQEKQKYQKLWDKCDARINDLNSILKKRVLGKISKQEEKLLTKYAAAAEALTTQQPYINQIWDETLNFSENIIRQFTQNGINFKAGHTLNIDKYTTEWLPFGNFKIKNVQQEAGAFKVTVTYLDPLIRLIKRHQKIIKDIQQIYPPNKILLERSAYLRQHLPEKVIKVIYADIYQYDNLLRSNINEVVASNPMLLQCRYDDTCRYRNLASMVNINLADARMTAANAELYIMQAEYLIKAQQLTEAKDILTKLNRAGFNSITSNTLLGQLHFYQHEYQQAVNYFKRIYKNTPQEMLYFDTYAYGVSLLEIGHYKEAEKVLKLTCNSMQADQVAEEELFALCQEKYLEAKIRLKPSNTQAIKAPQFRH